MESLQKQLRSLQTGLEGGCTSGHFLSGMSQTAFSSTIFGAVVLVALIVIAFAIPKMELFDEVDLSRLDTCERPDVECEERK